MTGMRRFALLTFLDLVSCAFGGVVLLFLIVASASSTPVELPPNRTLVIRCRHVEGARGEVGIEFRRPGAAEWTRERVAAPEFVSARSDPESGAEALLVILRPPSGTWEFRPYLADFPERTDHSEPTRVALDVFGQRITIESDAGISTLHVPGDAGTAVIAHIPDVRIRN